MERLFDNIFLFLQKIIYCLSGRKHFSIYNSIMKNEFRKDDKLTEILKWASENIPKYKKVFKKNSKIRLSDFPIVIKRDLQEDLKSFVNPEFDPKKLIRSYTGGSTGEPTNFYQTRYFRDIMSAGVWRSWTWAGWRPGEKILYIWGSPLDLKNNLRQKLQNFLNRKTLINAFNCNESNYENWVKTYNSVKPSLLYGYANSINEFSKYILENKISVAKPKAIVTSAEILFLEARRNIERAFGQKVYNMYGSREMWVIASECKEGQMHIFEDVCCLESIKDDKGIEHLLLTTFENKAMPIIRYDTDDTGLILEEKCPCDSRFSVMNIKIARQLDFLVGPNGKRIDPYFAYYKMYDIQGIAKYQFLQRKDMSIELKIKKNRFFSEKTIEHLIEVEQELKRKLSDDLDFRIKEVEEILPGRTGKHKFIISEIN